MARDWALTHSTAAPYSPGTSPQPKRLALEEASVLLDRVREKGSDTLVDYLAHAHGDLLNALRARRNRLWLGT